jgi:hypothetical protein
MAQSLVREMPGEEEEGEEKREKDGGAHRGKTIFSQGI